MTDVPSLTPAEVLRLHLRRLLELSYLHTHGMDATPESRKEWFNLYLAFAPAVGTLIYHGGDRFTWEGPCQTV